MVRFKLKHIATVTATNVTQFRKQLEEHLVLRNEEEQVCSANAVYVCEIEKK
jgi:hypothetical protein